MHTVRFAGIAHLRYEADDYVLLQGVSCHAYSELVIRKAVGANSYTFANNFNHSLTKKRISMMLKTKPKRSKRSWVLYFLPMTLLALSAFATPEFKTATEVIEEVVPKDIKNQPTNQKVNSKVVPPESESSEETVINIHIDSEDRLSCGINHAKLEPISPKDLMKLLAKHREEPTVINITSEKEFSQMKHVVREASRKNEHLKINYEVKPKSD